MNKLLNVIHNCNILYNFKFYRMTILINTNLFNMFCLHSHIFRKTFQKVTNSKHIKSQDIIDPQNDGPEFLA